MKASSDMDTLFNSLSKAGLSLLFVGSIITVTRLDYGICFHLVMVKPHDD